MCDFSSRFVNFIFLLCVSLSVKYSNKIHTMTSVSRIFVFDLLFYSLTHTQTRKKTTCVCVCVCVDEWVRMCVCIVFVQLKIVEQ